MEYCRNCKTEVTLNYCPHCGQPAKLDRIDKKFIIHEIGHVLHFERGFLYTIRELIINPGQNIRNYILENRSRLVKPIIFLIATSLIYSLTYHFFHLEKVHEKNIDVNNSAMNAITKWIQGNFGYTRIFMAIFFAFWTKVFFKKYQYNIFEIFILLCFVGGTEILISTVFEIVQGFTHLNLMLTEEIAGFVYTTWAIGQFFEKGKVVPYVKASIVYILGLPSFLLTAIIIGRTIDLITNLLK